MSETAHIEEWLPWYVNGTLQAGLRAEVEAHLESCARCREALAFESRIAASVRGSAAKVSTAPHAGWQALNAQLDAADALGPPVALREPRRDDAERRWLWRVALPVAVAAQGVTIVVLALLLWRGQAASPPAHYRTLASEDVTLPLAMPMVRVAFTPEVGEARAHAIAAGVGGWIVAGPSERNVYTLAVRGPHEQAARALRRMPEVLLAEPLASTREAEQGVP